MRTRLALSLFLALALVPLVPASSPSVAGALASQRLVEGHVTHGIVGDAPLTGGPVAPRTSGVPLEVGPLVAAQATLAPAARALDDAQCATLQRGCPYVGPSERDYFPGLRWTNDQFVLDPVESTRGQPPYVETRAQFTAGLALLVGAPQPDGSYQYPCGGTALAVPSGEPDPRAAFAAPTPPTYVESYRVTDPNDHAWRVDKWQYADAHGAQRLAWTVAISGCPPLLDSALARAASKDGAPYPGREGAVPEGFQYDAFLVFFLEDLPVTGVAPHGLDGERTKDGALAGNSHAFDPYDAPLRAPVANHGGSAPGGVAGDHATYDVDAYYSPDAIVPAVRMDRVVDTEGSSAPFG